MILRPNPDSTALSDLDNDDVIQAKHVLDLPHELLDEVFSYLDVAGICSSVRVCRPFLHLAEPYLYRDIVILEGGQAAALVDAFHQNPSRVKWVRSLLVSTKFGEDEGLQTLPPWIIEVLLSPYARRYFTKTRRWTTSGTSAWRHRIAT